VLWLEESCYCYCCLLVDSEYVWELGFCHWHIGTLGPYIDSYVDLAGWRAWPALKKRNKKLLA